MTTRTEAARRVLEETKRFEAKLPELLPQLAGRWVVFRDGVVASDHPNENEAYRAAVQAFGPQGGFVVAEVKPVTATPVTAAVMFGWA